jgi:site-specific recombinase XerD
MNSQMRRRIVLFRPRKDVGSFARCCELAGLAELSGFSPRYLDVQLLALLVDQSGMPVWTPTLYLAHCAVRSRSLTGDTVRSYAEALQTWLKFLDSSNTNLECATEDTLATFRNELVHRPLTDAGSTYASATANHRISVVCAFYRWSEEHGVLQTPLGTFLMGRERARHGRGHLQQAAFGRSVPRSLTPIVLRRLPRVLSYEEVHLLFQAAPMPYRLIFKWALVTGLRRFEICRLNAGQLPSPEQISLSRDGLVPINVLRKGSRDTTIYVPVRLVEETRWYVLTERPNPKAENKNSIFIGRRGTPISKSSVSRVFRQCANGIGTDATFHHLRHTFAVHVLNILDHAEQEGKALNSLKILQVLMGHASIESTEIYLRGMDVSSEFVMQALGYLYGATL